MRSLFVSIKSAPSVWSKRDEKNPLPFPRQPPVKPPAMELRPETFFLPFFLNVAFQKVTGREKVLGRSSIAGGFGIGGVLEKATIFCVLILAKQMDSQKMGRFY